jgi:hypothetical protein
VQSQLSSGSRLGVLPAGLSGTRSRTMLRQRAGMWCSKLIISIHNAGSAVVRYRLFIDAPDIVCIAGRLAAADAECASADAS